MCLVFHWNEQYQLPQNLAPISSSNPFSFSSSLARGSAHCFPRSLWRWVLSVSKWFYKNTCSLGIVFVKHRCLCGLIFPSCTFHSHITTLKIDQKPLPTTDATLTSTFWSHGLAEMAGQRNKWVSWPWGKIKKAAPDIWSGAESWAKLIPLGHKHILECQQERRSLWEHGAVRQNQDECTVHKILNIPSHG